MKRALALMLLAACNPAWAHIDKVECPIDVPPEVIAAYLGCTYKNGKTICPPGIGLASIAPQLTLDACDMVAPDGGLCE